MEPASTRTYVSDEPERLRKDPQALGELLAAAQAQLLRMITFRMDRRLQGRVDPSDVIQEAFLEASQRLPDYLTDPQVPFYVWLRFLTGQKLTALQRHHLGAQMRAAGREVSIHRDLFSETTSAALAHQLLGRFARPSEAVVKAEVQQRLQDTLNDMDETDREVLALRHFEQLTAFETARILNISEEAAKKRYVRALKRLKALLSALPGAAGELFS